MRAGQVMWRISAFILLASIGTVSAAVAEEEPSETQKEIERLEKEKELINAKASLLTAKTAYEKAQVDALGLPKFEGKWTVNEGALAVESTLLASSAVDATASKIATVVTAKLGGRPALVLTDADTADFGQVSMITMEIAAIEQQLRSACRCEVVDLQAVPVLALATAAAGLLKTDTELTALAASVTDAVLAAAVASKLPEGKAILPSAAIGTIGETDLMKAFNRLVALAETARTLRDELAKTANPIPPEVVAQLARLNTALTRYDAFFTKVTAANDKGVVPLVAAARFDKMLADNPLVLRVNPEKAGGTLVKRTNLITMLGGEAVHISGGVVSSFVLTEPNTGTVKAAGMVTCRTALTTLKRVQAASWQATRVDPATGARRPPRAYCSLSSE
jgi:hypothetical protein